LTLCDTEEFASYRDQVLDFLENPEVRTSESQPMSSTKTTASLV
jgi:hypothetical protein